MECPRLLFVRQHNARLRCLNLKFGFHCNAQETENYSNDFFSSEAKSEKTGEKRNSKRPQVEKKLETISSFHSIDQKKISRRKIWEQWKNYFRSKLKLGGDPSGARNSAQAKKIIGEETRTKYSVAGKNQMNCWRREINWTEVNS